VVAQIEQTDVPTRDQLAVEDTWDLSPIYPDDAAWEADAARLRELFYAVLGTVASGAADRSAVISTSAEGGWWTVTVIARQAEQLTDEHLMAGMLAAPEPPYRRRSTALWMLLADAIATRHGGSVELTFDPATGAGATIRLPPAIPSAIPAAIPSAIPSA
jgi:hypothetical protein